MGRILQRRLIDFMLSWPYLWCCNRILYQGEQLSWERLWNNRIDRRRPIDSNKSYQQIRREWLWHWLFLFIQNWLILFGCLWLIPPDANTVMVSTLFLSIGSTAIIILLSWLSYELRCISLISIIIYFIIQVIYIYFRILMLWQRHTHWSCS